MRKRIRIIIAVITIVLLTFAVFDVGAQPKNGQNPDSPACSTPNPPWWCGEGAPIDTSFALYVLIFMGAGLAVYKYADRGGK